VDSHNLDVQRADPASTANLYRRVLAARRGSAALHAGGFELLDVAERVLAYRRVAPASDGGGDRIVLVEMTGRAVEVALPAGGAGWTVEVASDGAGEGAVFGGVLRPDQAVVLRPA
jgi:alpha-glucosidase